MRAWLYCRVANGCDSDASDHLALQKTELEHFCTEHDLTIVGTSMTTGSGENELKTLVQNGIAQDSFDVLLTVSASRLSRDIRTALHVSRELFQCGKGLCLVKENICTLPGVLAEQSTDTVEMGGLSL